MKWASNSHHPSSDFSTATNLLHSWLVGLGVWFSLWVREVPGSNPGRAQSFGLKNKKEHIQQNSCHFDKLPLFPKRNVPWPGFEPGLLRPQRNVLTTIRSRLSEVGGFVCGSSVLIVYFRYYSYSSFVLSLGRCHQAMLLRWTYWGHLLDEARVITWKRQKHHQR